MKKYAAGGALVAVGIVAGLSMNATSSQAASGTHIRLAEASRTITLAPGAQDYVSVQCAKKEAVTGGGPTGAPSSLTIVSSAPFWDGVNPSGWSVQYKNEGTFTVTETPTSGALCVAPGYITH